MNGKSHILVVVISLALISFMSLSFAVSYSYITQSKAKTNMARFTTTNMAFTNTVVNLTNTNYEFEYDATKYATFTITKPASLNCFYYITVGHTSTASSFQATYLPYEDLWIRLYEANSDGSPSTPISYPTRILDNYVYSPSNATYASALYVLFFGNLDTTTTSKKYSFVIWGDPDRAGVYDDKIIDVGIQARIEPINYRTRINMTGTVTNSSNQPVSGATVLFQNGSITATTDSSGQYTLNNVPTGAFKLDVLDNSNSQLYSTTVSLTTGSAFSVSKLGPYTYTAATNTYIQKAAYAKYTTPYKILKRNNLTNSNYIPSVDYTTEPFDRIIFPDTLEVTTRTVNIQFASNNTLNLSTGS